MNAQPVLFSRQISNWILKEDGRKRCVEIGNCYLWEKIVSKMRPLLAPQARTPILIKFLTANTLMLKRLRISFRTFGFSRCSFVNLLAVQRSRCGRLTLHQSSFMIREAWLMACKSRDLYLSISFHLSLCFQYVLDASVLAYYPHRISARKNTKIVREPKGAKAAIREMVF